VTYPVRVRVKLYMYSLGLQGKREWVCEEARGVTETHDGSSGPQPALVDADLFSLSAKFPDLTINFNRFE
jgi:hypothetical protein